MRGYKHAMTSRGSRSKTGGSGRSRPSSAGRLRSSARQPKRPSSSNYGPAHVNQMLSSARRRAYGGTGYGGRQTTSSAARTYGNLLRGAGISGGRAYGSYGKRPASAQGGAYRLARSRQQAQQHSKRQAAAAKQAAQSATMHPVHQYKQPQASHRSHQSGRPSSAGYPFKNPNNVYWGGGKQVQKQPHSQKKQQQAQQRAYYPGRNVAMHVDSWNRWRNQGVMPATAEAHQTKSSQAKSAARASGTGDRSKGSGGEPAAAGSSAQNSPGKQNSSRASALDRVSGTLSVASQNNRSNPNAPLIKLSPRSLEKSKEQARKGKAAPTTTTAKPTNSGKGGDARTNPKTVATGVNSASSFGKSATSDKAVPIVSTETPAAGVAAKVNADETGGVADPNEFAKMREANRLLAERNLKLREELALLRKQHDAGDEPASAAAGAGVAAAPGAAGSGAKEKKVATTNAAAAASSATRKTNSTAAAKTSARKASAGGAAIAQKASSNTVSKRPHSSSRPQSAGPSRKVYTRDESAGKQWWERGHGGKQKIQRPQSAGRVKSAQAASGTGGGHAAAYRETLRPQRRPGSAGRTRPKNRPSTAPGRRRQEAPPPSMQVMDAASEEARLRGLMADVAWDGRGRSDMYHFGKVLGTGSFGVVRLVMHKLTGTKTAVKTYDKRKIKDSAQLKRVQQEIRLMARANHPNIVRLFETLESQHRVHLVMEFVPGGNLCSYVKLKKRLSESEARNIFQQIAHGIAYLHSINIAHRDIKLENILFSAGKVAKITDFGFSVYTKEKRLKVFCGTPSYMAPEIVMRREYYGFPVDVWSFGVLLYAMLCGCFPFTASSYPNLYKKIARGQFSMPKHLSQSVRDLLRRMIAVNPPKRLTMNQVRRHQWTVGGEIYVPKGAKESPLLVADNPSDDLQNNAVVSRMQALGFRRGSIVESVLGRKKNHITTAFYLLCDKMGVPKTAPSEDLSSSAPTGTITMAKKAQNLHASAGAAAGAAAAAAAAHSAAVGKKIATSARPSTAGSSRPGSSAGRISSKTGGARTSGFKRPQSAGRVRGYKRG